MIAITCADRLGVGKLTTGSNQQELLAYRGATPDFYVASRHRWDRGPVGLVFTNLQAHGGLGRIDFKHCAVAGEVVEQAALFGIWVHAAMMDLATLGMPQAKVRLEPNRTFGGDGVVVFGDERHDWGTEKIFLM